MLSFERLENRRLLSQTPQLLFDVGYDNTFSEGSDSLSAVFLLDDALVSRASGPIDTRAQLEVFALADGTRKTLTGFPVQSVDGYTVWNDELYIFYNNHMLFFGGGGVGQQVWKTDGHGVELVSDISDLGTAEFGSPQQPFAYGDHLYFIGDAGAHVTADFNLVNGELGLWRTDGTSVGTEPVTHLVPGIRRIHSATAVNGRSLLSIETQSGDELWSFDATSAGTQRLVSAALGESTVIGDRMFFTSTSDAGEELYVSDGTPAGTTLIVGVVEGQVLSNPRDLFAYQRQLFFSADTEDGEKLWKTDGSAGTEIVFNQPTADPTVVANDLYFVSGTSLFHWDDASAETALIHSAQAQISVLAATDHVLLLEADGQAYSVADPPAAVLFEKPPGDVVLSTAEIVVFADVTKSRPPDSFDSVFTLEFWSSDGTEEGTRSLADPIVDRAPSERIGTDTASLLSAQLIDDLIVSRFLTQRWLGDRMRISAHAIQLDLEPSDSNLLGDANRDGSVSFDDFLLLAANFSKVDAVWEDGDFNKDQVVDFADFLILANNFGASPPAIADRPRGAKTGLPG